MLYAGIGSAKTSFRQPTLITGEMPSSRMPTPGRFQGCRSHLHLSERRRHFTAWLVRRFSPYAVGSGIPHVEATTRSELPPAPLRLVPVKFIGGLLAIGSGLALGREGPSVQVGADIGAFVGKKLGLSTSDCIALLAACGGAGIATAFNASLAGAIFIMEELIRRFDTRIAIAALGSSCCAIAAARLLLGRTPDSRLRR